MSELLRASTWTQRQSGTFTTTIDASWAQGKGAFGGLLAAGLLRSMASVVGDERRKARTLHVHYCGPARPGPLEAHVVVERASASVTTLTARALQDEKLVTLATGTFMVPSSRPSPRAVWQAATMPEVPAPDALEPLPSDIPLMPAFTRHFDYRFCIGEAPFSAAEEARLGGWVRAREACTVDAPYLAALIDAYPPAVYPRLDEPRASASVNLTIDFFASGPGAAPPPPHAWFLHDSRARTGDGGTTDERQDLWTHDGRLVASCRQLVTIL